MTDCVEMQPIASMVVGGHPRVPAVANTSAMGAVAIVVTNMFVGMFVVTIERRTDGDVRGHPRPDLPRGPQVRTGDRVVIRGNGS